LKEHSLDSVFQVNFKFSTELARWYELS